jgi:hypothetical protein
LAVCTTAWRVTETGLSTADHEAGVVADSNVHIRDCSAENPKSTPHVPESDQVGEVRRRRVVVRTLRDATDDDYLTFL